MFNLVFVYKHIFRRKITLKKKSIEHTMKQSFALFFFLMYFKVQIRKN